MKKTSFKLTKSLLDLECEILSHMDIPRTTFHRRAIDKFIREGGTINPRLLVTKRNDPQYVKKEEIEQIYLDEERENQLREIADQNNCTVSVVLFQALLDYCCMQAPIVLGDLEEHYE